MNKQSIAVIIAVLAAMSLSWGQAINVASDPFSFPPITGIKNSSAVERPMYFKSHGSYLKSGSIIFSWSIADRISGKNGTIAVYSLLGRTIKTFKTTMKTGSIAWKPKPSDGQSGVYIAHFSFGSYVQNLKIILPQ